MKSHKNWWLFLALPVLLSMLLVEMFFGTSLAMGDVIGGTLSGLADLRFKFALVRHWKAVLGVALLLGTIYAIAHKPVFKFLWFARTAALAVFVAMFLGASLLIGEFWSQIEPVIEGAALFLRRLF